MSTAIAGIREAEEGGEYFESTLMHTQIALYFFLEAIFANGLATFFQPISSVTFCLNSSLATLLSDAPTAHCKCKVTGLLYFCP